MATSLGTKQRPLRVAVVGSGPSGFYAAEALLTTEEHRPAPLTVKVDMFEHLPAPFGLVRYGVAPDHEKIKHITKVYDAIALHEGFSFYGNVSVGKDISIDELKNHYDAIVFTCGAATDKKLGIPGEDLSGSHTATEFVAWYNGHPDYRTCEFDLSGEVAVIIGQGNVAMDVGRILCKTPDELKNTDIAQHALDALAESKIKEVHLVGRRGPVQAAFTTPEIREFGELADCDPVLGAKELEINEASQEELKDEAHPQRQKNLEILSQYAASGVSSKERKFVIHFLKSPKELKGEGRLEKVILEKNQLTGESNQQKAKGTGETEELPCRILFRSVGYRGIPIDGVPFDDKKGIFPNQDGRVTDNGKVVPGLYCSGWIKRGPSGLIGTNKPDSFATVENIFSDLNQLAPCSNPDSKAVLALLKKKNTKVIDFKDWQKIDAAEIQRGQKTGKPLEKFVEVRQMLAASG